jgi:hypothetical protein
MYFYPCWLAYHPDQLPTILHQLWQKTGALPERLAQVKLAKTGHEAGSTQYAMAGANRSVLPWRLLIVTAICAAAHQPLERISEGFYDYALVPLLLCYSFCF